MLPMKQVVQAGAAVSAEDDEVAVLLADDLFDDGGGVALPQEVAHLKARLGRRHVVQPPPQIFDVPFGLQSGLRFGEAKALRPERVGDVEDDESGVVLAGQVPGDAECDRGVFREVGRAQDDCAGGTWFFSLPGCERHRSASGASYLQYAKVRHVPEPAIVGPGGMIAHDRSRGAAPSRLHKRSEWR